MKILYHFCFLAALFLITLPSDQAAAEDMGKPIWQSKDQSSIRLYQNDEAVIETQQYLYTACFRHDADVKDRFVVSQRSVWRRGEWEGNDPYLEATVFVLDQNGIEKKLWSVSEKADEGFLSCDFYSTVWYGCCSAAPNHRLYHLKTGTLVNEFSDELLTVEIPNTPLVRYIGYKPAETLHHHPWEKNERHIGTLTYGTATGMMHRIVFRGRGPKYDEKFASGFADISLVPGKSRQEILGGSRLALWFADKKNNPKYITDFKIDLEFYGCRVQIEIREDDFFLTRKTFPDYEIIRLENPDNETVRSP